MAKIPISRIRMFTQRRAGADAVAAGVAANRSYAQICDDIVPAVNAMQGRQIKRGEGWYRWLYLNVCNDDGSDLCPPPPGFRVPSPAPLPIAPKAQNKVFISYRRDDTEDIAGRISDRLTAELGKGIVFFDVNSIPLGANFPVVIRQAVALATHLVRGGNGGRVGRFWPNRLLDSANGGRFVANGGNLCSDAAANGGIADACAIGGKDP